MNRGDTLDFKFDVEGAEADLSSAFFSCKKDPNDDEYIFQKSLGDGIVKVSTALPVLVLTIDKTAPFQPSEY